MWAPQQSRSRPRISRVLDGWRVGGAAVSKYEDAAEIQFSSRPVHNQFNQERHLVTRQVYKAETLDRISRSVARSSRHRSSLASGRAALRVDECCYSDDAVQRIEAEAGRLRRTHRRADAGTTRRRRLAL